MKTQALSLLASFAGLASAALLWDGRFNSFDSAAQLNNWSWGNPVGPYQWYIHGNGPVSEYVELSSSYGNPADLSSKKGAKITLTNTAYWNGQNMRRTELIPETKAAIVSGTVYYHFSIKRDSVNPPSFTREHQIAFFESHFTELKSGGSGYASSNLLRWQVGGQDKWTTNWAPNEWHNIAYEIDFSRGTVGLWHSTGSAALKRVVAPISASTNSNGKDWHVGVLELPNGESDKREDFFFSGTYIENGAITTSVTGPTA